MAGYSGTPLTKKLGVRAGSRVWLIGAPKGFQAGLDPLPEGTEILRRPRRDVDVVVCFCPDRRALSSWLRRAKARLRADGGLWLAWPKKSSQVDTDLTFDVVQTVGLAAGLVDNKVCAVDETWSGLRFVYRLEDRAVVAAGRPRSS